MAKRKIVAPESSKVSYLEFDLNEKESTSVDERSIQHQKALNRCDARKEFVSISDQIAENVTFFRNFKYPKGHLVFPDHPEMQMVSLYYPLAKGGPLLVDEVKNERQMLLAYEKQRILLKKGYRHIVIENDSTLSDCLEQLGEL